MSDEVEVAQSRRSVGAGNRPEAYAMLPYAPASARTEPRPTRVLGSDGASPYPGPRPTRAPTLTLATSPSQYIVPYKVQIGQRFREVAYRHTRSPDY
jgi:hypothetical protein